MAGIRKRLEGHARQPAAVIGERHLHRPESLEVARPRSRETCRAPGYPASERQCPVDRLSCTNLVIRRPRDAGPRDRGRLATAGRYVV